MPDSPFKFLNAYEKEDKDLFFGRETETEELYELSSNTRLILLYGASGTGKTSLVKCGLANKFSDARWQEIFIRKGDNINESLLLKIQELAQEVGIENYSPSGAVLEEIAQLHRYLFKPIYLVFDQFEELFILGNQAEQREFFEFIKELLNQRLAVKVILVMREEFIAYLWDFEKEIPTLFDYRYRIENMRPEKLNTVVKNTLVTLEQKEKFCLENTDQLSQGITEKLRVGDAGIELTYLQIYLEQLYRQAEKEGGELTLKPSLINSVGEIEDAIGTLLDVELVKLGEKYGKKDFPLKLLGEMVSDQQTKKTISLEDLEGLRKKYHLSPEALEDCLQTFENMRIIRRYED